MCVSACVCAQLYLHSLYLQLGTGREDLTWMWLYSPVVSLTYYIEKVIRMEWRLYRLWGLEPGCLRSLDSAQHFLSLCLCNISFPLPILGFDTHETRMEPFELLYYSVIMYFNDWNRDVFLITLKWMEIYIIYLNLLHSGISDQWYLLNWIVQKNKFDLFYSNVTATPQHWSNGFKIPYLMSNDDSWNKNHKVSLLIQPWHNTNVLMIIWPQKDRPIKIPSFKSDWRSTHFPHIFIEIHCQQQPGWERWTHTNAHSELEREQTDHLLLPKQNKIEVANWQSQVIDKGQWMGSPRRM